MALTMYNFNIFMFYIIIINGYFCVYVYISCQSQSKMFLISQHALKVT